MDMTTLMICLVAGSIGMGMIMFAKTSQRLIPAAAGLVLLTCPYFIANTIILVVVCAALTLLPFVYRDA